MRISHWCTDFGYEIVPAENRPDIAQFAMETKVWRVVDMFTTRDGKWQGRPEIEGAVPDWAIQAYNSIPWGQPGYFDDAGGSNHIFFCCLGADAKPIKTQPQFALWSDGFAKLAGMNWSGSKPDWMTVMKCKTGSGWGNLEMFHSSGYNYQIGTKGAWCVTKAPGLADVVRYVGLPMSWHVSTFVAFMELPRSGGGGGGEGGGEVDTEVLNHLDHIENQLDFVTVNLKALGAHLGKALPE